MLVAVVDLRPPTTKYYYLRLATAATAANDGDDCFHNRPFLIMNERISAPDCLVFGILESGVNGRGHSVTIQFGMSY